MLNEFKAFIARGNVIDLAVGVIMGVAFTAVVDSAVKDLIMPPVGALLGGFDFSNYFIQLTGRSAKVHDTVKQAQDAGVAYIGVGLFINALIKFLIVAWAVFLLVKAVNRLHQKPAEAPKAPPPPPPEVALLTEIRDLLRARG
jgi:large conductance mechanosensitive channel